MTMAMILAARGQASGTEFVIGLIFILVVVLIAVVMGALAHYDVVIKNGLPYCPRCNRQVTYRRDYCRACGCKYKTCGGPPGHRPLPCALEPPRSSPSIGSASGHLHPSADPRSSRPSAKLSGGVALCRTSDKLMTHSSRSSASDLPRFETAMVTTGVERTIARSTIPRDSATFAGGWTAQKAWSTSGPWAHPTRGQLGDSPAARFTATLSSRQLPVDDRPPTGSGDPAQTAGHLSWSSRLEAGSATVCPPLPFLDLGGLGAEIEHERDQR